jgi:P27 family predicted phage terminase small subunit
MSVTVLQGGAGDVPEPDWKVAIPERLDGLHDDLRTEAHDEWARVTRALREAGTLAPENARQVKRLVLAYLRYDIAAQRVMADGAVVPSPKTQVPQLSLWQVEMRQADGDANAIEMELCLNPRRRGNATKVAKKAKAATAADAYLRRSQA